jgi:hypothetical protein
MVDISIGEVRAHKLLLSLVSVVFKKQFYGKQTTPTATKEGCQQQFQRKRVQLQLYLPWRSCVLQRFMCVSFFKSNKFSSTFFPPSKVKKVYYILCTVRHMYLYLHNIHTVYTLWCKYDVSSDKLAMRTFSTSLARSRS